MIGGKRTHAQEVEWHNALNRIKGTAEVASKVAKTMGETYQAGYTKFQPAAPSGFGMHYDGARPLAHAHAHASAHAHALAGGAISNDFARKLIENRIAQLDAQKGQASSEIGGPQAPAPSSAEGTAVTGRVEALLSSLSVSLESGLFTGSAIVEPAKEVLSALLTGASELNVNEIDSIHTSVQQLLESVDFDSDALIGGKVAEVGKACRLLLKSAEFVLDSQRVEALRGDSVLARRHSLKAERTQLAKARLESLGRSQAHIRAAARDAAAARGHVASAGTEDGEDDDDDEDEDGQDFTSIEDDDEDAGPAATAATGPVRRVYPDRRAPPVARTRYDEFRAQVAAATNKSEALDALASYERAIGVEPSGYTPTGKTSVEAVKRYIRALYPEQ